MAHEYPQTTTETASDMSDLTGQIERTAEFIGKGGFGCVYKGKWVKGAVNPVQPQIVVKVMNLPPPTNEKQKNRQSRQMKRELELWSKINHNNILPLLGIAHIDNPDANFPAFVSAWMKNGNARLFRSRYPDFPPLRILYDIIQGLHYLHTFEPEIVHGDIKAVNVLINDRYEARLCDFGLSRFLVDTTLWRITATRAGGSLPWMSPELMNGMQCAPTKESDMYAYAMTCYEILSGNVPFDSVPNDANLIYKVAVEKQRPQHVKSLDNMWDIITKCWAEEPENRPRTIEVLELVRPRIPPYPSSIDRGRSSTPIAVDESKYYSVESHSDQSTALVKSTNRRYLSVNKILRTEDERMVQEGLIEPIDQRYLNVSKVLEN